MSKKPKITIMNKIVCRAICIINKIFNIISSYSYIGSCTSKVLDLPSMILSSDTYSLCCIFLFAFCTWNTIDRAISDVKNKNNGIKWLETRCNNKEVKMRHLSLREQISTIFNQAPNQTKGQAGSFDFDDNWARL